MEYIDYSAIMKLLRILAFECYSFKIEYRIYYVSMITHFVNIFLKFI